jgi:hypothetical protein
MDYDVFFTTRSVHQARQTTTDCITNCPRSSKWLAQKGSN